MMTQAHKYLLVGILVGLAAYWVWQRRSSPGGGGSPEG
jgi:hypothetical protein